MNQPFPTTATEAAALVRTRQIGAVELVESTLARIDAINPALNAVVELRREEAMAEAKRADQSDPSGPLHGVPITIKEAFDVDDMHSTWGVPDFAEAVAERDAAVVGRLKEAGAIVVGTTNVETMLADFAQTSNPIYGRTNNPWDLDHAPGGSSGGAAAAVAAGCAYLDYGSDVAGSIRIPASFCGVYGLRPSVDLTPAAGFQPPGPPARASEMTYPLGLGPIARSAADLRVALSVTAGPAGALASAYDWRLSAPRHEKLRDFRVGVVVDDPDCPTASDVARALGGAIDAIADTGATIVEGWPADVDPGRNAESFSYHLALYMAYVDPASSDFERAGEFIEQERRRMAARDAWASHFDQVDVFLCPVDFTAAIPHDDRPFEERTVATPEGERSYAEQPYWVAQPALPGLPAVAAPVGRTEAGLPVGIQIIGPLFEDDTALTFADLLGEVVGGFEPPPLASI